MKRKEELEESKFMLEATCNNMSIAEMKKMELIEQIGNDGKNIKMIGRSLFIFSKSNCLRRLCFYIVNHRWYDRAVFSLITISSILLTLDDPNMDPESKMAEVLLYFDYVLTVLFTLECLINAILSGLICNGKTSYARDPWNCMDILIVTVSILSIIIASQGGGDGVSILKVFRLLRVLRPLRFLKRNFGLKI